LLIRLKKFEREPDKNYHIDWLKQEYFAAMQDNDKEYITFVKGLLTDALSTVVPPPVTAPERASLTQQVPYRNPTPASSTSPVGGKRPDSGRPSSNTSQIQEQMQKQISELTAVVSEMNITLKRLVNSK